MRKYDQSFLYEYGDILYGNNRNCHDLIVRFFIMALAAGKNKIWRENQQNKEVNYQEVQLKIN